MKNLFSKVWKKVGRDLRARRPVPQASCLPKSSVPQASCLPKSPVPQASRLPRRSVPRASRLPKSPVPQASRLPRRSVPRASRLPKSSVPQASRLPRGPQTSALRSLTSVPALCLLISVLCLSSFAQTWIIDGKQTQVLKLEVTDPQAARNFGTNTVYSTTNAVARWIALTNGLALEIHSSTGWVRQVEYTED